MSERGGAALLRNAKHRISSIVKNHRYADELWECGREKGEEKRGREKRRERVGPLPAVSVRFRPAYSEICSFP